MNYKAMNPMDRLMANVKKTDGCWLRTTQLGRRYGAMMLDGKMVLTHRAAYMLLVGPIPEGLNILHRCDNTLCINPAHLFLGTQKDNVQDMFSKGRAGVYRGMQGRTKGTRIATAKLNDEAVAVIRTDYSSGLSITKIARKNGVDFKTIHNIIHGKAWKHVTEYQAESG